MSTSTVTSAGLLMTSTSGMPSGSGGAKGVPLFGGIPPIPSYGGSGGRPGGGGGGGGPPGGGGGGGGPPGGSSPPGGGGGPPGGSGAVPAQGAGGITPPRVGGVANGVVWLGGSNVPGRGLGYPIDVLCFRPMDFKSMQKQHELLKEGLEEAKRLELGSKGISLTAWIQEIKFLAESRGFDTLFRVYDPNAHSEVYLLERWGDVNAQQVADWVNLLKTSLGDHWDKEGLRLSASAIRQSLGPDLYARVASLTDPSTTSGPEYFKVAVEQISFMNATMIRNLSNKLGQLKLKDVDGENVAKLTEQVTAIAREIQGSGSPPSDLHNLVSKPYTTGTVDTFKTHALGIHGQVMTGSYRGSWEQMVQQYNLFYQDLVQSDDYPPAKGGKDQDDSIHAMIGKEVDRKLELLKGSTDSGSRGKGSGGGRSGRKCFECGSDSHLVRDCPKKKAAKDASNWRTIPPDSSRGDSKEKVVDGVTFKWCGKCRSNKGFWCGGDKAHFTSEHSASNGGTDGSAESGGSGESSPATTTTTGSSTVSSSQPQGQVAYIDAPLAFGFFGSITDEDILLVNSDEDWQVLEDLNVTDSEHPKGCCGDL